MPRRNRQIIIVKNDNYPKGVNFCKQKNGYINDKKAIEAAEYQMLINQGLELSVYKCNVCGLWHLTRQVK